MPVVFDCCFAATDDTGQDTGKATLQVRLKNTANALSLLSLNDYTGCIGVIQKGRQALRGTLYHGRTSVADPGLAGLTRSLLTLFFGKIKRLEIVLSAFRRADAPTYSLRKSL